MAKSELQQLMKDFAPGAGFGDPEERRNAELRVRVALAEQQRELVADQLSTPEPTPDRIEDFKQSFRSSRYAVPVWLIFVVPTIVAPAIVGWWTIFKWILAQLSSSAWPS